MNFLQEMGLINPRRMERLIEEAISAFCLDLSGLVVFTEAASRNFVVTPVIAAMAGAKVYAVTADSRYGLAEDIKKFTYEFADLCGVADDITVLLDKTEKTIGASDIVTNLGFVRPIDLAFIRKMKDTAAVSYMFEAWEFREREVDTEACLSRGIPVMAVDEEFWLPILNFSGYLCIKMLLSLEIEVQRSKIAIMSNDKFGRIILRCLKKAGARPVLVNDLKAQRDRELLRDVDALVIADYKNEEVILGGENAQISVEDLLRLSEGVSVIQFAGDVDTSELERYRVPYYPKGRAGKHKMCMTLADLGPRPVIELNAAGLKVGEVLTRARRAGLSCLDAERLALQNSPAQSLN